MRTQRGRELAREAHTLTQHQQEQKTDPVRVLQLKAVRKKRVPLMYFCTFVLLGGKGVEGGGMGRIKLNNMGKGRKYYNVVLLGCSYHGLRGKNGT